ncbi:MAG: hypothetical protein OIN88_01070 [Candidatus Methanoperedens sp.]|nr:hypothetical protein [Candidatus Methanoperedens sp.]MCZ7360798.1 hypothetical protein [Candidatus Methanoperedens sp.]HLB71226.1 hypothetical protein [Candidatus Methanoperedens sp.]
MNMIDAAILAGGYVVLIATSGKLVNYTLSHISEEPVIKIASKEERDTGFVIGKCENFLILTFMYLEAYTALALVFTAKAVVRREDISKNTLFFLAGTMINVTYSIMMGFIVKLLTGVF